jgi:hypothetical protein
LKAGCPPNALTATAMALVGLNDLERISEQTHNDYQKGIVHRISFPQKTGKIVYVPVKQANAAMASHKHTRMEILDTVTNTNRDTMDE